MNISKEQSTQISRLIEDFINSSDPDSIKLKALVAKKGVLPLLLDWGGVFAISPSGEIISFAWDDWGEMKVETDARIQNVALFQGSKKYPELAKLIVKPNDARVCWGCGGTGTDPKAAELNTDDIVCYCGGLGWIP